MGCIISTCSDGRIKACVSSAREQPFWMSSAGLDTDAALWHLPCRPDAATTRDLPLIVLAEKLDMLAATRGAGRPLRGISSACGALQTVHWWTLTVVSPFGKAQPDLLIV